MRSPSAIPALLTLGLGLIGLTAFGSPTPLLIYNATASAPVGFYLVRPIGSIYRGDLVLARTPEAMRQLAAERGYLPSTVPLVKRVAALRGDTVCGVGAAVTIDGRHVADRLAGDRYGRPMPIWTGCRTLGADDVFLLMQGVRNSFDGRYFGVVSARAIIGKLVPLWAR